MLRRRRGSVKGRVALVTGAASGIGRATARLLAARGARLALVDRDGARLVLLERELRAGGVAVVTGTLDVTSAAALEAFRNELQRELGVPDLIVNAAGVVVVGSFFALSDADWERLFAVNVKGTVNVCRTFLPALVARGGGGEVVNVSSAAAFATPGELSAYGATKHALIGLSQSLNEELAEHDVHVAVVCPGFVDTPIVSHLEFSGYADPEAERHKVAAFHAWRALSAERVAEAIVRAVERRARVVPVGAEARILQYLSRVSASSVPLVLRVGRRLLKRSRE